MAPALAQDSAPQPWETSGTPPVVGPVQDVCDYFLGSQDEDTRFVGKTTVLLSAGWIAGADTGALDDAKGSGPTTGAGMFRDWGKSTVRRVQGEGRPCALDTTDARTAWRVEGLYAAGTWSKLRRIEAGGAWVYRFDPDWSGGLGLSVAAQGIGSADVALAVGTPTARLVYGDWVSVRLAFVWQALGSGSFRGPNLGGVAEVAIAKAFKEEHFRWIP